jgi:hypothetical protein
MGRSPGRSSIPPGACAASDPQEARSESSSSVQLTEAPPALACPVPLMNLQLRAIETTEFERRVAALEKRLADAEDKLELEEVENNPGTYFSRFFKLRGQD